MKRTARGVQTVQREMLRVALAPGDVFFGCVGAVEWGVGLYKIFV